MDSDMQSIYRPLYRLEAGQDRISAQLNYMLSEIATMKTLIKAKQRPPDSRGKLILAGILFAAATWLLDTDLNGITEFLKALGGVLKTIS